MQRTAPLLLTLLLMVSLLPQPTLIAASERIDRLTPFRQLAVAAADYLVSHAIVEGDTARWPVSNASTECFTSIQYGAAGIGNFLLTIYNVTGNQTYLTYAQYAGNWLLSIAQSDASGVYWSISDQNASVATGMEYGVAGVIEFLFSLYNVTGDTRYLDAAKQGTAWLYSQLELVGSSPNVYRIPSIVLPTRSNVFLLGLGHGEAGVALAFLVAYNITGNQTYLGAARGLCLDIINHEWSSTPGKWPLGYYETGGVINHNYTGLENGALGIGIALSAVGGALYDAGDVLNAITLLSAGQDAFKWVRDEAYQLANGGRKWPIEENSPFFSYSFTEGSSGIAAIFALTGSALLNADLPYSIPGFDPQQEGWAFLNASVEAATWVNATRLESDVGGVYWPIYEGGSEIGYAELSGPIELFESLYVALNASYGWDNRSYLYIAQHTKWELANRAIYTGNGVAWTTSDKNSTIVYSRIAAIALILLSDLLPPTIESVQAQWTATSGRYAYQITVEAWDNETGIAKAILYYNCSASNWEWRSVELTSTARFLWSAEVEVAGSDLPDSYLEYYVVVWDVENHSTISQVYTTGGDFRPPTIYITEPENGSILSENTVAVKWTASDSSGISKFEVYLDSKLVQSLGGAEREYVLTDLLSGHHTIAVIAYDNSTQHNSAKAEVSIIVDTNPPYVEIIEPAPNTVFKRERVNVTVRWNARDYESGIAYIKIRLDEWGWRELSPEARNYTYTNVEVGNHTVHLLVCDKAGHETTATRSFIVKAPEAFLEQPETLYLIIAIIAVAGGAAAIFAVFRWKKQQKALGEDLGSGFDA